VTQDEIDTALAELPMDQYLRTVAVSAQQRAKALKGKTARASFLYDIAATAGRYLRVLRG